MPDHDVVIEANWELDNHYSALFDGSLEVDDSNSRVFYLSTDGLSKQLNLTDIRAHYKYAHVQIVFTIQEKNDGYQDMFFVSTDSLDFSNGYYENNDLFGVDGKINSWLNIETNGNKVGTETYTHDIYVDSDDIKNTQAIVFNAHGNFEDDYYVTYLSLNIWFYN